MTTNSREWPETGHLGRDERSVARLQRAFDRAIALQDRGEIAEAAAAYRRLLVEEPERPTAIERRLAWTLLDLGEIAEARALATKATDAAPDGPPWSWQVRAIAEYRCGDPERAADSIARAVAAKPADGAFLETQGNIASALGRHDLAEAAYRRALIDRPAAASLHAALSKCLRRQGRVEEAEASARRGAIVAPGNLAAQMALAEALLALGRWEEGWAVFERRFELPGRAAASYAAPPWRGEDLDGKRVLLWREQSRGDVLQFCRFALTLRALGAEVTLGVEPAMTRLLSRLDPAIRVLPIGAPAPSIDHHAPLMSLPALLGLGEPPAFGPYLSAEPERVAGWREAARLDRGFTIGVHWRSDSDARERSIPLEKLAPLAALPGVRLVALQRGPGAEELAALPLGMTVEQLGPAFEAGPDAHVDSAAVIESLDLVLSCDSALAHLAGALGSPVWLALTSGADWRWGRAGARSAWYPSARLFRQETPGDWDGVVEAMRQALESKLYGGDGERPSSGAPTPLAPIAWSELFDKIARLESARTRNAAPDAALAIDRELRALEQVRDRLAPERAAIAADIAQLSRLADTIAEIEEAIRAEEARQAFDFRYVELCRALFARKDERAALMRRIDARSKGG